MANERRLIDANEVKRRIIAFATGCHSEVLSVDSVIMMLNQSDTVEAVPLGAYEQVRWERDQAMEQLEEHGIPFGGIAPDVVKVVRCKDCKKRYTEDCLMQRTDYSEDMDANPEGISVEWTDDNDFCSYGKRKDNERKTD